MIHAAEAAQILLPNPHFQFPNTLWLDDGVVAVRAAVEDLGNVPALVDEYDERLVGELI